MVPSSAVPAACACGRNKLAVSGEPSSVYRCHCTDCRELSKQDYIHCAAFMADQVPSMPPPPFRAPNPACCVLSSPVLRWKHSTDSNAAHTAGGVCGVPIPATI